MRWDPFGDSLLVSISVASLPFVDPSRGNLAAGCQKFDSSPTSYSITTTMPSKQRLDRNCAESKGNCVLPGPALAVDTFIPELLCEKTINTDPPQTGFTQRKFERAKVRPAIGQEVLKELATVSSVLCWTPLLLEWLPQLAKATSYTRIAIFWKCLDNRLAKFRQGRT